MAETPIVEQVAAILDVRDGKTVQRHAAEVVALVGERDVQILRDAMFYQAADLLAARIAREVGQ